MRKNDPARPFWNALFRGDVETLRTALKKGADPNACFPLGKASSAHGVLTPLLQAARCGQTDVCKVLLDHGAKVEGGNRVLTPLLEATLHGYAEIAGLLKKRGARASLFTLVVLDDGAAVKRALKKNKDFVQEHDEAGQTPLHYAARMQNAKMMALLLSYGAKAGAGNEHEVTPLHTLCNLRTTNPKAQKQAIALLLKHGADVNAKDWRGVTPLHMAVRARNVAACEVLLAAGADVNSTDRGRGSTPLRRAVTNTGASGTKGRTKEALAIANLLLKHGADPLAKDAEGRAVSRSARGKTMLERLDQAVKRKR